MIWIKQRAVFTLERHCQGRLSTSAIPEFQEESVILVKRFTVITASIMILFVYVAFMMGSAIAAGWGAFYVVENQLLKAGNKQPQFISLLASLFSFGITLTVIYFALLQKVMAEM
jgi:hypothetical protein